MTISLCFGILNSYYRNTKSFNLLSTEPSKMNSGVYGLFLKLKEKISKYLNSSKYFNIEPTATKLCFKLSSHIRTTLWAERCPWAFSVPTGALMSGELVCPELKARQHATATLLCNHYHALEHGLLSVSFVKLALPRVHFYISVWDLF